MPLDSTAFHPAWHLLTRLGEFQILLPALVLVLVPLARRTDARPLTSWWLATLAGAVLLTVASKLAFIGWGIGSAPFNFTGISGHAMFAAAIYPLTLGILASKFSPLAQNAAVGMGFGLAAMVGVSRVVVGVHSESEVLAGLLLGGAVSIWTITKARLPRAVVGPMIPVLVLSWFLISPMHTPQSQTHAWVTRMSLALSGKHQPYTRIEMLRELARR